MAFNQALEWIASHSFDGRGIATDDKARESDPGATRRMIPPLEMWGEVARARQFGDWLASLGASAELGPEQQTFDSGKGSFATDDSVFIFAQDARRNLNAGDAESAKQCLEQASSAQLNGGGMPAYVGSRWLCPLRTAEIAALWFRCGDWERGESAYQALLKSILRNGVFGARVYDPTCKNTYAETVATFLEALHYRLRANFERTAHFFPASIVADDGRYALIEDVLEQCRARVVADVGCGKGRFIKLLKGLHPEIEAWAIDISKAMLGMLPEEIHVREGSLLATGMPDAAADYVVCIEALEHALNARAAVRELARITARPGTLVIIDKCATHLGTMQICDWEQWFHANEVTGWLQDEGFQVVVRRGIRKPGCMEDDQRFLTWIARR